MTREQAIRAAKREANERGVSLEVTFDPYNDEEDRDGGYGYLPIGARDATFNHEVGVVVIHPKGEA